MLDIIQRSPQLNHFGDISQGVEVLLGNDFPAMHDLSEFLNSCESEWSHRVNSHKENEGEPILSA